MSKKISKSKKKKVETTQKGSEETEIIERSDDAIKRRNVPHDVHDEKGKKLQSSGETNTRKHSEEKKPKKETDKDAYMKWLKLFKKEKKKKYVVEMLESLFTRKYNETEQADQRWKCLYLKGYPIPEMILKSPEKKMRAYFNKGENKQAREKNIKKNKNRKKEILELLEENNMVTSKEYLSEIVKQEKSKKVRRHVINMKYEDEDEDENEDENENMIYETIYSKYKLYQIYTLEWDNSVERKSSKKYYGESESQRSTRKTLRKHM